MRSKLTAVFIGLLLATGTSLVACSSSGPVPDDPETEATEYDSLQDEDDDAESAAYEDYESAEEPATMEGGQPPMGGQQQPQGSPPRATGPVATVDGEPVTADEFNERLEQEVAMMQQQFGQVPPELLDHITEELVDQLVQQQLLFNAIDEADMEISEEDIDERVEQFRQEFLDSPQAQMEGDLDFDDVLAREGLSQQEFREIVEKEIAMEALLEERGAAEPTEEEVRQYYEDNPQDFTEPEKIEAYHVLVGVTAADEQAWEEARAEAEEIRRQVMEDEEIELETTAMERGDHVIHQQAPVFRDQQHQPAGVEEAAFELEDGELSEPIRTQQGWLLIERISHEDERLVEFEEVEEQLEQTLRAQAMGEAVEELLAELREEAVIELHPENIE